MSTAAGTPLETLPAGAPVPPSTDAARLERVLFEIKRVIVGQDRLVERMLVALLARGHVLLEGVPGVAKTLAVETLATAVGGKFARLQFTPDLVPADIIGTRIYKAGQDAFDTELGPVFANFVLADEINRAPAKVQSALLEVMQERQVTIGRETHRVPEPFLVLATQNPIETEGTYQLPEAQVDRFMLKVLVGYPSEAEEVVVVQRMTGAIPRPRPIITTDFLLDLQREADRVSVDPQLMHFAVRLVGGTRDAAAAGAGDVARYLTFGASPRASINLILGARALAMLRGRDYVLPRDLVDLAPDVLRHRLVLSYEALADGVSADAILARLMACVPPPAQPLTDRGEAASGRPGLRFERGA